LLIAPTEGSNDKNRRFCEALTVAKRYGLSVVLVLWALLVTLLVSPTTRVTPFFFLAIMLSAWVGGMGPGLAALFEPFYTTKPAGMGMGLSICRSIIEAHGGRLWATANGGYGATFHFTLPAAEAIQPDAAGTRTGGGVR